MRLLCVILIFALLAGCGSKGPLYLPDNTKDGKPKKESAKQ
ncbi:MAG: LPS translocon maturation chaperone LptM [Burkholderiales bacterium]